MFAAAPGPEFAARLDPKPFEVRIVQALETLWGWGPLPVSAKSARIRRCTWAAERIEGGEGSGPLAYLNKLHTMASLCLIKLTQQSNNMCRDREM